MSYRAADGSMIESTLDGSHVINQGVGTSSLVNSARIGKQLSSSLEKASSSASANVTEATSALTSSTQLARGSALRIADTYAHNSDAGVNFRSKDGVSVNDAAKHVWQGVEDFAKSNDISKEKAMMFFQEAAAGGSISIQAGGIGGTVVKAVTGVSAEGHVRGELGERGHTQTVDKEMLSNAKKYMEEHGINQSLDHITDACKEHKFGENDSINKALSQDDHTNLERVRLASFNERNAISKQESIQEAQRALASENYQVDSNLNQLLVNSMIGEEYTKDGYTVQIDAPLANQIIRNDPEAMQGYLDKIASQKASSLVRAMDNDRYDQQRINPSNLSRNDEQALKKFMAMKEQDEKRMRKEANNKGVITKKKDFNPEAQKQYDELSESVKKKIDKSRREVTTDDGSMVKNHVQQQQKDYPTSVTVKNLVSTLTGVRTKLPTGGTSTQDAGGEFSDLPKDQETQ